MSAEIDRKKGERERWLDEPRNVDRICYGLYALCALLVLADFFYAKHPHFAVEGWFGFYGFFGFVGCVGLVLAAKLMRKVVMRGEDYYDQAEGS